jgi:hypothetical protein
MARRASPDPAIGRIGNELGGRQRSNRISSSGRGHPDRFKLTNVCDRSSLDATAWW